MLGGSHVQETFAEMGVQGPYRVSGDVYGEMVQRFGSLLALLRQDVLACRALDAQPPRADAEPGQPAPAVAAPTVGQLRTQVWLRLLARALPYRGIVPARERCG